MCGEDAWHKVEEVLFDDDPTAWHKPFEDLDAVAPARHPFTAYVCPAHFRQIMGLEGYDLSRIQP